MAEKRKLTEAELAQRRKAAPFAAHSKRGPGARLARLKIARAREILQSAQVEAARNLVAGMRGQLPPEIAEQIVTASRDVLTRGGNPPLLRTENTNKLSGDITFVMEDPGHVPEPARSTDDPPADPEDADQRP